VSRPLPFLLLLACAIPAIRGAGPATAPASTPVPAVTAENFLPALTAQLGAHFRVEGELQLDLLRSWAPLPAPSLPWEMVIITPPAALAPQNILRVRLLAGTRNLGEWNLPVHAQLWSDALVPRQPLVNGAPLDPTLFDLRRVDLLRDKDAIPASADLKGLAAARSVAPGVEIGRAHV
jgi:hypothetical protein